MKVVALVIADAAGSAEPDALASVHGEPLLSHAVRGLLDCQCVDLVVITAPARRLAAFESAVFESIAHAHSRERISVLPGSGEYTDSARLAFNSLEPSRYDVVLIHDVARAFTPSATVQAVAEAVREHGEVTVPVLPVTDTVKSVDADDVVTGTRDRAHLRHVQTPHGFPEPVLRSAFAAGEDPLASAKVRTVPGHPNALRMTSPFDLIIADAMLAGEREHGGKDDR